MSSTANMMRRMPSAFAGALSASARTAGGVWNFVSSTRPGPSGVRIMVMSARTSLSPTVLSTQGPSTCVSPCQLHTEFGEERFGSLEVVDNDENVVHPLNRHFPEYRGRMFGYVGEGWRRPLVDFGVSGGSALASPRPSSPTGSGRILLW